MQISEVINLGSKVLKNKKIRSYRLDSEIILSHILRLPREKLLIREDSVCKKDILQFKSLINRRLSEEPIAYIVNKKEFRSIDFFVNKNSLIPRPETELLIDPIVKIFKRKSLFLRIIAQLVSSKFNIVLSNCLSISSLIAVNCACKAAMSPMSVNPIILSLI